MQCLEAWRNFEVGNILENRNCLKKKHVKKHLKNTNEGKQHALAFCVRAHGKGAPVYIL